MPPGLSLKHIGLQNMGDDADQKIDSPRKRIKLEHGNKSKSQDFQILAILASSDDALKSLLSVVASGKASQEQRREFQKTYDLIHNLIKHRANSCEPTQNHGLRPASADESLSKEPESLANSQTHLDIYARLVKQVDTLTAENVDLKNRISEAEDKSSSAQGKVLDLTKDIANVNAERQK